MQTATDIIKVLEGWAAEKRPIHAQEWLDAAQKMTLLMGDEADKLFQLEQNCALERIEYIDEGKSATEAKMRVEASEAYKEARSQKALMERIIETVRLAKHRARLANEEYKAQ